MLFKHPNTGKCLQYSIVVSLATSLLKASIGSSFVMGSGGGTSQEKILPLLLLPHVAGGEREEGQVKQVFVWLLSYELSSKHILRSLPVSGL